MATNLPNVSILYADGGLLRNIDAVDGIAGLVCSAAEGSDLIGEPTMVVSLADAETKGFTEEDEPAVYRHLKEFYDQLVGSQEFWVMLVPNTMAMSEMLSNTELEGARKLLTAAGGRIRLLAVARTPDDLYDGGAEFIDADVSDALTTSKTFCLARLAELNPIRVLIEGRVVNPDETNTLEPKTFSNGFAGVVLGGTKDDGSASVGLALGRAVRFSAEIKIGKVKNGSLNMLDAYIGETLVDDMDIASVGFLHGAGFISFMKQPRQAGYFFGIDRMATEGDDRLLVNGRVLDKAAIIAAAVYIQELEGEVDVDSKGNIDKLALKALETSIKQAIYQGMGGQISKDGLEVYIDPSQGTALINTNTLNIVLRVRPKGYTSFIIINLGLTAPSNS